MHGHDDAHVHNGCCPLRVSGVLCREARSIEIEAGSGEAPLFYWRERGAPRFFIG